LLLARTIYGVNFQLMVNGLLGNHGHLVQSHVVEVTNHEHVRVQALDQPMVGETVKVLVQSHKHVGQLYVQVSV
jgi:hypothetical protein